MTAPRIIEASALDLAEFVRPGDQIVVGQGTAEPLTLTETLVGQRHILPCTTLFLGALFSKTFPPDGTDGLAFAGYGAIGNAARLAAAGRLDVVPTSYRQLPDAFAAGRIRANVVLLQLARDREGRGLSLGLVHDYVISAARQARIVIAELNDDAPWTYGAELRDSLRIDVIVPTSRPLVELPPATIGEIETRIGTAVGALVPDGATLQLGVGTLPDAILAALRGHRDLGIHSGMIGDRVLDLIEAGVVTNTAKPFDTGITIAGALFGTTRLAHFADLNPSVMLRPPSHTHEVSILGRLDKFFAINAAVEVDLTGQVNAEVAAGRYVGAIGGQPDFVRGALAAANGRSIIALPSTTRDGALSRIVGRLNGPVTTPRSDADLVVTEWGVAELAGQSLAERRRRMIAIAAPAFREELERMAR